MRPHRPWIALLPPPPSHRAGYPRGHGGLARKKPAGPPSRRRRQRQRLMRWAWRSRCLVRRIIGRPVQASSSASDCSPRGDARGDGTHAGRHCMCQAQKRATSAAWMHQPLMPAACPLRTAHCAPFCNVTRTLHASTTARPCWVSSTPPPLRQLGHRGTARKASLASVDAYHSFIFFLFLPAHSDQRRGRFFRMPDARCQMPFAARCAWLFFSNAAAPPPSVSTAQQPADRSAGRPGRQNVMARGGCCGEALSPARKPSRPRCRTGGPVRAGEPASQQAPSLGPPRPAKPGHGAGVGADTRQEDWCITCRARRRACDIGMTSHVAGAWPARPTFSLRGAPVPPAPHAAPRR